MVLSLLAAGKHPAEMLLRVREDLRTRFGWGLVYQILAGDEARCWSELPKPKELITRLVSYRMITHHRRDMQSLSHLLRELDHYSLETKRAITRCPLLRELIQNRYPWTRNQSFYHLPQHKTTRFHAK